MARDHVFAVTTAVFGLLAFAHAVATWPPAAVLALFGGGALLAFTAEAIVISRGWLEHHIGPSVYGVPLYVLFGWTGVSYLTFRGALLVTEGWLAVVGAGLIATSYDILTDHVGVKRGYWTYTDHLPGPRLRGVPWWNFAGWLCITALTAAFAQPFI